LNYETASDNELAEFLKSADGSRFDTAFCEIMKRYKNPIVSFLFRYTGDMKTAEDLSQEVFVRVFKKIKAYNSAARFSTWLYTIAVNLAKDEFKRRSRHPAVSYDWQSSGRDDTTRAVPAVTKGDQGPEEVAEKNERSAQVQLALNKLEDDDREILILREIQGMKYEEISKILDLPLGTVKSRIARARLAFKDLWERKSQ
jgi:RNA polymerase sigma-70 factor (ECF subfamily)